MSTTEELAAVVGEHLVSNREEDLAAHSGDWSPAAFIARRSGTDLALPACIARPRSTADVTAIVAWAHEHRVPLVPYGGGSGVCGGVAPEGAVVLDLRAMDRIVAIDDKSRLVTVQAGVGGTDLADVLAARNFTLGHEPQSVHISTVGGWLSTRACGQLSAGYGGIEDLVVGLEAVLPPGRIVRTKTVPRRATGPDLAALLIGAEGTLGVITEATLRIFPSSESRADVCVRFEHMADGVAACRKLAQSELKPTLVRLYDAEDAVIFLRHHPGEPQGPLLLLSFEGRAASDRAEEAKDLCGGTPGNNELVGHWWVHRNDAVEEYRSLMTGGGLLGPHALVETIEMSGTWTVLRDLYHSVKEALSGRAQIVGCHLSHVYADGAGLYFTMASMCESDEDARKQLAEMWDAAMRACLDAGGSISHHHGIGRVRAPYLSEELGEWWPVLKGLKQTLDPHRIMNPGVLGL